MGARKKRRTRFEYLGRHFHWWMDDWRLHICSEDKKFAVAYVQGDPFSSPPLDSPHLEVHGHEFPGVDTVEQRPVLMLVPKFVEEEWNESLGAFLNALIRWCMRDSHKLQWIERFKKIEEPDSAT